MFVVYKTICNDVAKKGVKYERIKEFEKMDEAVEFMNDQMERLRNTENPVWLTLSYTIMIE